MFLLCLYTFSPNLALSALGAHAHRFGDATDIGVIILEGTPHLTVVRKDHSSYSCHFSINLASFRLSLAMSPLLLAVFAAVCLLLSSFRPESVVRRRRRTRKCTLVLPSFLPSFLPTLSFLVHFLPPQSIHLKVRPSVRPWS